MFLFNVPVSLEIPWEAMEGMLKGISAIDMNQMTVRTREEAEQFILNYGYDLDHSPDRQELEDIRHEAISFIQRRFLDPHTPWEDMGCHVLDLQVPNELFVCDLPELLLHAATGNGLTQRWACAVLKVMHILCHINNAVLYRYFEEAKAQIMARYDQILSTGPNGELLFGSPGEMCLSLAGFEMKDEKSRDSMLLKLLCKRENVAEEVFDMIGVRIITHTAAEAILALEILRHNKVILFPNIIPSRSRNSLVDFDAFKVQYQEAVDAYKWGQATLKDTLGLIEAISAEPAQAFNPSNASTLESYRAIHITERQLIRHRHPMTGEETRFFFPYEIQLVDEASFLENASGSSAHSLYKQNQLLQARRRVLGPLFITLRKQHRHAQPPDLAPEPLT